MSDELVEREIATEQAFVDRVHRQLETAGRNAQQVAREGHSRGRLGHEGGLVERDAMVFHAAKRIAQLDAAHEGLVFGRLDLRTELDAEPRYVGRIGLRDEDRDTLLIDWRAPAAAVFYQATAAEPQGVVRRRVLRSQGTTVQSVEDELLDADGNAERADGELPIVGEGALMAQLSRARDRRMHSIVATIQAEQDKAIRAPAKGVVAISGGPGVGKTVVALHRAAYLLYTDRRRYETDGVLVVGPSGVFMRYIERVLPSLGETAVALRSLGEVVDGVRATRHDEPAVADIKGSERMAEVMRRAARQQAPGSPREFRLFWYDNSLVLDRGLLGRLRRQLMSQGRRNRQLPRISTTLLDALWRQVRSERGRDRGRESFNDDLLDNDDFLEFALAWWPPVDAPTVLSWLHDPEFLARVGDGVLTAEEQRLLLKSWSGGAEHSIADVPLIDELRYALGDVPRRTEDERDDPLALIQGAVDIQELMTASDREYAPSGRAWQPPTHSIEDDGFAHVLIDEAQDLTPMQWRMVGRRGRTASWTIVGDPAQSSWPVPAESTAARSAALEGKPTHEFHLSTNYRNSAEIYAFAAAYAQRVGLAADLPTAVRSTGIEPRVVGRVPDLEPAVRAETAAVLAEVAGTVGIVVPVARRSEVNAWLASWPEFADYATGARAAVDSSVTPSGDDRVVVLTGLDTKGLEFDGIVVVQPEEIEAESATGRATLYVVLTRATQLLTTVSR
ncbi:UvrD-helicase domain-containing protein [Nocardioides sp. R-C-SC26]|uniref:HelD family protein n=1 Tax=Nocardioides sp. R-C-SC26 TaxID=2870414 RepID=UPI001E4ED2CA|nr:UvrD-helicase domain-containing protein [Nocardioides sp. R-C-SC26]